MITVVVIGIGFAIWVVFVVWVIFKVIKIPLSPISLSAFALVGVIMQVMFMVGWTMSAPMSDQVLVRRSILTVVPDVEEFVSKVHVKTSQMVSKVDVLFEVNPDCFQDAVDRASAELKAATSAVAQREADVAAAEAKIKQEAAETKLAKTRRDNSRTLQKEKIGAIEDIQVVEDEQKYQSELAEDKVEEALLKQSQLSLSAAKKSVDVAQAAYDLAAFNLERCTYTSTVDGQVMNFQVTEGTPANRLRMVSIGSVQDLRTTRVLAVYRQNMLKNVKAGNVAEVTFRSRPGQVFSGKVDLVTNYTGEGHFQPSLVVPAAADIRSEGCLAVRITLDDEDSAKELPLGAAGTAAIYTGFGNPLHLFSKIGVRVHGWMNYMPFEWLMFDG